MNKVSVTLSDEHLGILDEREEATDAGSRSEALRSLLDEFDELADEVEGLREERDDLRARCDDLAPEAERAGELSDRVDELESELERTKRDYRLLLDERQEKQELQRYVEHEKTKRELKDEAPVWQRAKWWVSGMPDDDED